MKYMKKHVLMILLVAIFGYGCSGGFSNEDKARDLVQEWNAKNLDEAGYISNSFEELTKTEYKNTPAYRVTHRFNYGNKGRVREYYYFVDTTFTQVLGRKRTKWDKENEPVKEEGQE
jgi:hypothetical protein